jgi:2-oxoisovalerate dehydrogenase E2 component (dihydrolipoyl transacylase)
MSIMSTVKQFRLPDVGEGLTEAEIVSWKVAVGDQVQVNDALVEIETAKSLVELPSPYEGTVLELLVPEGQTVPVGTAIISVEPAGEAVTPVIAVAVEDAEPAPAVLVGYGPSTDSTRRRRPRSLPAPRLSGTALAKPPVRKLAKDLGVDLASVAGSGSGGVITRDDVLNRPTVADPPRHRDAGPGTRIPIRGVRRATAEAMSASAFTAPHVTVFLTVDVTRSVKLLRKLKADRAFAGSRVTMTLLAARALVATAREFPYLNASFDADAAEIRVFPEVNLGIATASARGLLVPNIKDAGSLPLPALASAVTELIETARAGKASTQQLTGGTITITNVGVFGVDSGTPILNLGESAILCLGAVRRAPAEHKGRIALRWTTQLSMSFDHRLIDGELGGKALARIGQILANPRRELLLT